MSDHVSGNDPGCGRHVVMDYGSASFAVRDRGTECLGTRDCEAKMKDGCPAIRTKSSTNLFEYVNGPQSLQPSP